MRFSRDKTIQLSRRLVAAACCAWIAALPATALADRIVSAESVLQRIKIVNLDGARIAYRTPSGELRFIPLGEIESLRVDTASALADLNEAERLVEQDQPDQAISHYERAVRLASGFWQRLVRARLILAARRGNRVDLIVDHVTALLDDEAAGAPLVATLLPGSLAATNPRGIDRAIRRINGKIDAVNSQSARVVLDSLRYIIIERARPKRAEAFATALVRQPIPLSVATRAVYRIRAAALTHLIADGQSPLVLREVNADLLSAPKEVLAEVLIVKARALLATAKNDSDRIRAGWAAMRVVSHYRKDPLVPEALFITARVHELIGRPATAVQLLDECIANPRISEPLRERATAAIDRLRAGPP